MSRAIGSGILINIFLMRCRGLFFRMTFKQHMSWIRIVLLSCGMSILLAAFSRGDMRGGWTTGLVYTDSSQFAGSRAGLVLLIGTLLLSLIGYFVVNIRPHKISIRTLCILFLVIVSIVISYYFGFAPVIMGRALIAALEEWTKTSANLAFFDRFHITSTDCIFFGLLSALGFAFTENIVYLFSLETMNISSALGIIIKRMCTSRMMHLTYSGLIALGILAWQNNPRSIKPIGFLVGGVIFHTLFNYFLQANSLFITLIIILLAYFFLTRLLYKSDRVYLEY